MYSVKLLKFGLNLGNRILNSIVILALILAFLYAGYGLWDNNRIYAQAEDVQDDMIKLKPAEDNPSFEELLAINKDVKAWLTLDNTNIDYPVLQGENNLSYFNTDVYGEFALSGSIFLDSRNEGNFGDSYSLIYGHHMEKNKMFGDLDLYKEENFFKENQTGTLILPDRSYKLEIFAVLLVPSGEQAIFNPLLWKDDIDGLTKFTRKNQLYVNEEGLSSLEESKQGEDKILSLTTCSNEFTDARTVVLARMIEY